MKSEISCLRWGMVTDVEGNVGEAINLDNKSSKGRNGGRTIFLAPDLREALVALKASRSVEGDDRVIFGERTIEMSPTSVQVWFHRFYRSLGFEGASSHSGRRTFITKLAKKISEASGSLKDVQELAGHASLSTTQRYIQGSNDAKRRVIGLI
jgi:integrase/recombinase XerC